ncbi:BON domain-containing protein [Pseudodesulfovibrio sp. zrk46]|uniref:BON domain-containing protein n=1 Tax=Pseudodesulfovibrio sp. zrk46 TaxID=2725288 RepID=UPI0014498297|nr:BON domain-containing protein [Pseudodesulfovibrio sp. zrk46]QJB56623.1 BON domain-containing protein [Pseudodesulfovibrio sp. zrk46]
MKRSISILFVILMLVAAYMTQGCAMYDVAVEERNVSTYSGDKKISFLIEEKFLDDNTVKFLDFDAYTYEGHVYLIGEYESHTQVERAVKIAKGVKGVKTVTTYFMPKKVGDHCGTTDNLSISSTLRKDLIADGDIWSTNIDIEMIQCHVVLLGIVGSAKERDKAIAHAKSIEGVRGVKSYIKVR